MCFIRIFPCRISRNDYLFSLMRVLFCMFFYAIVSNTLAYPEEIELPNLSVVSNSTEFRTPFLYAQERVTYLARMSSFPVFDDLASALAAIEKSKKAVAGPLPTHTTGILCLPAEQRGETYTVFNGDTADDRVVIWTGETPPKIHEICFRSAYNKRVDGVGAFDLFIYDDYAALWQSCHRESSRHVAVRPKLYERELTMACSTLDIAAISSHISKIPDVTAQLPIAPLVFLFSMVVLEPLRPHLKVAIALLVLQGEHECIYKDDVFEELKKRVQRGVNKAWLSDFFEELILAVKAGCFKSCDYDSFISDANKYRIEACEKFLTRGIAAHRAHKAGLTSAFLSAHELACLSISRGATALTLSEGDTAAPLTTGESPLSVGHFC